MTSANVNLSGFCSQAKSVVNLLFSAYMGDVSALRRCPHSLLLVIMTDEKRKRKNANLYFADINVAV